MTKLASKFIDHHAIQAHHANSGTLSSLDISRANQKENSEVSIGLLTQSIIDHLLEEGDVSQHEIDCFYAGFRVFFTKAFEYCCLWLRLDDELLKHCVFVDVRNRVNTPFSYVEKTLPFFKHIHQTTVDDPAVLERVHDEYIEFQAMPDTGIPPNIWKNAELVTSETEFDQRRKREIRMDVIWGYLRHRFPDLAAIALTVLIVPHSNAAEESVFSVIRKNKNEFRARLKLSGSLISIMRIKMAIPESLMECHEWKPSKELLTKCKKATMQYNTDHASKSSE